MQGKKTLQAVLLVLFLIGLGGIFLQPGHIWAADTAWDSGHNTTNFSPPLPPGPPGPDPGPPDPPDPAPPDPPPEPPDDPPPDPPPDPPDPPKCKPDCNNTCKSKGTGSPVYLKSGDFVLGFVDFEIAGVGPTLKLSRTYHSQERYNGPFGYGWVSSLTVKLIKTRDDTGTTVIIRQENGIRLEFVKNPDGSYTPTSPAVTDTLVENPDGTYSLNCTACSAGFLRPSYVFDENGNLTIIEDINGNTLDFTYDGNFRLLTVSSSATARSVAFTYGTNDKIVTVTDSLNRVWTYTYDADDNLVKVTDPLNYDITYAYDLKHNLVSVTDKNGNVTYVVTYDDRDRVSSYGRPGALYTYVYFTDYTTKTDPLGNTTTYYFDANGNMVKTVFPDGSEELTQINADVRPLKITDANGGERHYTYNEFGQILTETDPLGNVTTYTYDPRFQKIATITDPRGNIWTNTYDENGNLVTITDPLSCTTTMTYNEKGQVLTETDGEGYTFTYEYDASGNQTKIIDPDGNETVMTYDALGRLLTKTDARGNTWTNTYDLMGRIVDIEDPLGNHATFTYDGEGNRITATDYSGNTSTFAYDAEGRKISQTDADGNTVTFTYDAVGNMLSRTDALGNTTSWTYNSRNQVITETDALGNTTSYTYDPAGRKLTKTDARSKIWSYTYDAAGNLLTETNPLNQTISYEYDANGNRTKITDPNGHVTYFEYDAVNKPVKTIVKIGDTAPEADEDDIVTVYTYDCLGRKVSETNALGETTVYEYNFRGQVISQTNDLGETKTYTYDENGNKTSYTTVTGNVITYTYDQLNRMATVGDTTGLFEAYEYDNSGNKTKITAADGNFQTVSYTAFNKPEILTDALGNTTSYAYDANYNLVEVTDRRGKVTKNEYDALNRLVKVTDPLNNSSSLEFDEVGNMVKMTDAKGAQTTYAYDDANRLTTITYDNGTSKWVSYDAAGRIISKTDQNGDVITFDRDEVGRIVTRHYYGNDGIEDYRYDYTYDKLGRLLTGTNAYGTVTMTYDAAGRITSSDQNGTTVTYSHDVVNRTRTINYPSGASFTETFTLRDKIASIDHTISEINVAEYTYDALGRPVNRALGNGLNIRYDYNANGWVTGVSHRNGETEFLGFDYGYDKEGNRLFTSRTGDPSKSEQYEYDDAQRLTRFKRGALNPSNQIESPDFQKDYTLDSLGNWTTVAENAVPQNRTVNSMSQYTAVGGVTHVYDSNGNLVDDGVNTYTYDYENQLIKITRKSDSQVIAQYTVDAFNRRVKKTVGGVTTEFIYDDSRVIEERVNNVTTAYYVYGLRLDEPVMMNRSGQDYYYHADILGSTAALTDSTGNLVESYIYNPYGKVTVYDEAGSPVAASVKGNPYLFTGRRYDVESALYYYRARYLNPALGRFMNPDPKGFIDGMNLYEYAMSNPLRYVDPRGTATESCSGMSFSFDGTLLKKYLPAFLAERMGEPTVAFNYKKCKKCCPKNSKYPGKYRTDSELSLSITWSGDTGYISTPWGIGWDVDVFVFHSKGFVGLVAQVSWGFGGSLSGSTDNCADRYVGKGCINGSVTVEAMFGLAMEEKEAGWFKAYVSGGITGGVALCIEGSGGAGGGKLELTFSGSVSGAIKGTVGIWRFTYEQTFYEINQPIGPLVLLTTG